LNTACLMVLSRFLPGPKLRARFTCDSLKLGMVKHREVATCLGGTLYDCVCKFMPGTGAGGATA
jgi:type II pantothenate kinase